MKTVEVYLLFSSHWKYVTHVRMRVCECVCVCDCGGYMGHGVRLLNIFRIYHGNYIQKDGTHTHTLCEWVSAGITVVLFSFQSPKGLTDFPFTGFNFNLYTDLNNFTLKSRIVAIVWNTKCAPRSYQYAHKGFSIHVHEFNRLKIARARALTLTHIHGSGN